MSRAGRKSRHAGFSLIELVIVVVIIAIIGAIAIPRMSRGAAGAADAALVGDLAVLRNALDLYATEHGGVYPTVTNFETQLTLFSDANGGTSASKTTTHIYGPYLRKIPPLPVGTHKGSAVVVDGSSGTLGVTTGGWFYNPSTGSIQANIAAGEKDTAGKDYNTY